MHNETVNKSMFVLLHCIIGGEDVNVGRIVVQEIKACAGKKDGMLYLPCLITALCLKHGLQHNKTDEVCSSPATFDKTSL